MMHTESRNKTNGGNRAAPVTLRQKRPGRDRDPNKPERCPRVIVRKGRGTGIQTTAIDTRIGIHQSRGQERTQTTRVRRAKEVVMFGQDQFRIEAVTPAVRLPRLTSKPLNYTIMKAFDFLSAITELGISNDVYALFSKNAKIKGTPAACVQTENQFIFIYEME